LEQLHFLEHLHFGSTTFSHFVQSQLHFGQGAERTELLSPKQASLAEDFGSTTFSHFVQSQPLCTTGSEGVGEGEGMDVGVDTSVEASVGFLATVVV